MNNPQQYQRLTARWQAAPPWPATVLNWILLLVVSIAPITLPAQTYTDLYDVTCDNGCLSYPPGILAQGRDGNLYGTMFEGGNGNQGTGLLLFEERSQRFEKE